VPDFLLELLSEEIPARMQAKASQDLAQLFTDQLSAVGITAEAIESYATPRRLALIARNLPAQTQAVREETKGPRTGAPPQALEGFLRKTGLTREQLQERDGVFFAVSERPGRSTSSVLAEALPAIVRAFPWPKSMRWGAASASSESIRWVRPLQGIVALLGEEIVELEVAGVTSGAATVGHRFHHPGIITIGSANDYAEKLRACHVIIDPRERRRIIAEGAEEAAQASGLTLVQDEGLLQENAGLTEWPVPLLGSFDPAFLEVPREVIQLTMRTNQKYFALTSAEGELAPNFVCTANVDAADGGSAIVAGNQKVLAARLSDAKFFWEQDLKVPLEQQAKKLDQIVFHEKLGSIADKVERVAKLARWLVEQGIVRPASSNREQLADQAQIAARLCKADLVTGMVGEFPELQGIIGGYLARAQGHADAVADAIRDHYKPVGQGDEVPAAPLAVAVSLADKLDTLLSFFAAGEKPTGSKDPFALRRSALAALSLIITNRLRVRLTSVFTPWFSDHAARRVAALGEAEVSFGNMLRARLGDDVGGAAFRQHLGALGKPLIDVAQKEIARIHRVERDILDFFADRLKVQQREAGVRHDLIDAVFALGGEDDLVRLLARVHALQNFVQTREGADLLTGYKRAANILKKEGWTGASRAMAAPQTDTIPQTGEEDPLVLVDDPGLAAAVAAFKERNPQPAMVHSPLPEEAALIAALDAAEPKAAAAVEAEDFEGAMAALATLRSPVDTFFDTVTVNDPDPAKREARLNLLARMRDAVHRVADFSRIEG
jgi:glycyl-tRNA synthetase beta chain